MSDVRFAVVVFVYATDVGATTRFYETLGLRRRVSADSGGYEVLGGRAGQLAVHGIATASRPPDLRRASLTLETRDARAAARSLRGVGLTAHWWDEAYGRQLSVVDPHGEEIWISEQMRDLYGYRSHDDGAASPVSTVCAVSFTDDPDADTAFYAHLGFRPAPGGTRAFRELQAAPGAGTIGLHEAAGRSGPGVEAALTTTEDLAIVVDRVRASGWPDAVSVLDRGERSTGLNGVLRLVDPDGRALELRTA